MRLVCHVPLQIVLCAMIPASLVSTASAVSISLVPVADAFVSSANPSDNYGGAGAVAVSAPGLPKGEFQSVLKFNLSSAKTSFDAALGAGHWTLQSVALQLTAATAKASIFDPSAGGKVAVSWMANSSWVEGTGKPISPGSTGLTFISLPSFLSASDQSMGMFTYSGGISTSTYSLAVSPGLVGKATTGSLASLHLSAADAKVSGVFNSHSFTISTDRPLLTLTAVAVPEPASWVLGVLGITGLAIARRRIMARCHITESRQVLP
jgi:hypothetical protein